MGINKFTLRQCFFPFLFLITLLFIKSSFQAAYAQEAEDARLEFDQAVFDTGANNGGSIIQDRDGFLWIGTNGRGLIRYDGYDKKEYKSGGLNTIASPGVFSLFEDRDGLIWIVTGNGLNRYDKTKDTFTIYKNDSSNPKSISTTNWLVEYIQVIDEDQDGILWFGTPTGLNAYDKKSGDFVRYQHDPNNPASLAGNKIHSVLVDHQGDVWVGMYGVGLDRLDKSSGKFIHYPVDPNGSKSLGSHNVIWIHEDVEKDIWVATTDLGLYMFNRQSETFIHYAHDPTNPNSLASDQLYSLYQDSTGRIWIVYWPTAKAGLSILDKKEGTFTHYTNVPDDSNSLSTSLINTVYEDRSGIIWVVHNSGIVDKLDPRKPKFKLYRHNPNDKNSLPSNVVVSIYSDSQNLLWIGQDTGLFSYDKRKDNFTAYLQERFYPAMLEDSSGTFWLGGCCNPISLDIFDQKTGKIVKSYIHDPNDPESLPDMSRISNLLADNKNPNIIWISSGNSGIVKYDKQTEKFTHYMDNTDDTYKTSRNRILKSYQSRDGMLWTATMGGGLNRFDPQTETFKHYVHDDNDPDSISADAVNAFYEDSTGAMWVGTSLGFDKFDETSGKFIHYTEKTGFPVSNISTIVEDDEGNLWMGSHGGDGLIRFNPRSEAFKKYSKSDGLQGDVFLPFNGIKDRDGELWFGGPGGMNSFYPSSIKDNAFVPPVVITSLKQGGEEMALGMAPERVREITLDWKQNYFEFSYTALNFTQAKNNQYRYMLEGLDKEWFNAGGQRYGRYSALPGGDYTLRIIGSNNDGVWNEKGASLRVKVIPPFWQTGWFYGICTLGILGTMVGLFYWRVRRLRGEKEAAERFSIELENQVKMRTAELAQANTSLERTNRQLANAKADADQARDKAEVASRAKTEFLANMSHELRTPLNGILGYAQILQQSSSLTQSQHNGLDIIRENGQHLLSLINDILDLSKIEAQKLELNPTPIRLSTFLEKIVNLFQMRAQQKELMFSYKTSALPNGILADEKRLRQVLINLLSNAEKYTDTGEITFQVSQISQGEVERDSFVRLSFEVIDTGIGMTQDQLKRLFRPFEQFNTSDRKREGTGLGLALSRRLVQAMGSDLKVSSTSGVGSRFWFEATFPQVGVDDVPSPLIHVPIGYSGPLRKIMIVDDKLINRKVLLEMLQPLGFELREAESGREALKIAHTFHPDLIMMDLLMPDISGIQATQILRKTQELHTISIIAMSASVFDLDQQESLLQGCDAFLPKPIMADQLFVLLEKFLKIEWLYPSGSPAPQTMLVELSPASDLPLPPPKVLRDLSRIASEGDIAGLLEKIDQIEKKDNHMAVFTNQIRLLASRFETEQILALLEKYRESTG